VQAKAVYVAMNLSPLINVRTLLLYIFILQSNLFYKYPLEKRKFQYYIVSSLLNAIFLNTACFL